MKRLSESDKLLKRDIKRANERLRQLAKQNYSYLPVYQNQLKSAINNLDNVYKSLDNKYLMPQFRTDVSQMSDEEKKELRNKLDNFLKTKTSTISGAKDYEKKLQDLMKDDLTWDDILDLFNDSRIKKLIESDIFASDEIIEYANDLNSRTSYNIEMIKWIIKNKSRAEIDRMIKGEEPEDGVTQVNGDYI